MRSTAGFASAVASDTVSRSTAGFGTGVASTSVLETTVFGLAAPRRRRTFIFGGGVDFAASAGSAARAAGASNDEPPTKVNRLNTLPVSTIIGVRGGSTGSAHKFVEPTLASAQFPRGKACSAQRSGAAEHIAKGGAVHRPQNAPLASNRSPKTRDCEQI